MSNLTHKQEKRAQRDRAWPRSAQRASTAAGSTRKSSGHVATMRFLGCAPPCDRDIQRITRDALIWSQIKQAAGDEARTNLSPTCPGSA
eukprot:2651614-Prymnesium_polylepis.1